MLSLCYGLEEERPGQPDSALLPSLSHSFLEPPRVWWRKITFKQGAIHLSPVLCARAEREGRGLAVFFKTAPALQAWSLPSGGGVLQLGRQGLGCE